ncbi:hypothetical protein [Hymenobacter cheonanensis]|uniref:hypothetical protein n=1 Tax=Hymenobacter sp. CA2-7 TaxID=3063993 RepID=UPI002712CFFF|nr:hypothetical protein [Hymenobacter sp. CA2-7]MDO7886650.1 hypothetical protein [Hymenobacter sp. CA2-7]
MNLEKITDYHVNRGLLAEVQALLAPSYVAVGPFALKGIAYPVPGMRHELYTLRDADGQLAAFCTVGYHDIAGLPCGYMGLIAVGEEHRIRG